MVRLRVLCLFVFSLLVITSIIFIDKVTQPILDLPHRNLVVHFKPGQTVKSFVHELNQRGVNVSYWQLSVLIHLLGAEKKIHFGHYDVLAGQTTHWSLYTALRYHRAHAYAIRFIDGWTLKQYLSQLHDAPALQHDLFGVSEKRLCHLLGLRQGRLEGWLFPETYHYSAGDTDFSIMKRAHQLMVKKLMHAWKYRAGGLAYHSPYEALIMASLLQRESADFQDQQRIAYVLLRRFRLRMKLQVDPTVNYAMGISYDKKLVKADLMYDSPYNTYRYIGLPPTPIAMPGVQAIKAALNPVSIKALYYRAGLFGKHYFSQTYAEHMSRLGK